ncbi:MAG: AMP-binding protein [Gammaproteobacteria bacterium]|nr:AMP-binding protein [Gammaproteobacteria bacterium]
MRQEQTPFDNFVTDHLPAEQQCPDFINMDCVNNNQPFNCAVELLDNAITEGYGEKVAIYSLSANWTYKELLEKTNKIARVLTEDLGLIPGNRVLIRSKNNLMLAACWLAIIKAGGVVVSTIAMLRAKELQPIAAQSQASIALCDSRLKDELVKVTGQVEHEMNICYFNGSGEADELELRMENKPATFYNYCPESSSAIALMGFTSGTTGKPKAAVHSHHAILAVCETFSKQVVRPNNDDIFTGTPPLAFVYGLGGLLLFPFHARAATVMLEDTSCEALIAAIVKFNISILFTAPTMYKILVENTDIKKLASLRMGISAGEPLPKYVTQNWLDKTGIRLIDGLGSTELLHVFLSVQSATCPVGSLGKAVPGYETRVVDNKGHTVPKGTVGLLAARGPTGCRYLNDPRQTNYVVDGWNITGDAVIEDEDGYFWYQARTDGMIITSGYNVASPEVEHTISQHSSVAECAVIGIPDQARGEIIQAHIVLNDGYTQSDDLIKEIQDFAKHKSAPYKYPRSIKFIDILPRTPTGKVQHFLLNEQK